MATKDGPRKEQKPLELKVQSRLVEVRGAKQWITPGEIAKQYNVSNGVLREHRRKGTGPEFKKVGHRTVLYSREKFEAWFKWLPNGGGGHGKLKG